MSINIGYSIQSNNAVYQEDKVFKAGKDKVEPLTVIPFNQSSDLISKLKWDKHETLLKINSKFGGLCDVVCNRILIDDQLNREENSIKKCVTVERMNEEKIKKSHILNVYSIFRKAMALLFGIYPDNIFSCFKQWKLVNKDPSAYRSIYSVNRKILGKGLENIVEGETLKLEVFDKRLSGHSMLIKKMPNNKYIFFDPNSGEHRDLSFSQLSDSIDEQLKLNNGTDIFLMKGQTFLKRLKNKIGKNVFEA